MRGLIVVAVGLLAMLAPVGASQEADARARGIYARAVRLDAAGNHGAALPLLWEAAGLAPRDAEIQDRLGEALERLGALDAAVEAYRAALTANPAFTTASNHLILALVKVGKGPEAVARARALVAERPADPERLFTLGLALAEQDIDEAIATFRRVTALAPRHVLARYNLALVLRRADRLPDAEAELQAGLAIEPRAELHYSLGVIAWHRGDLERAAEALRSAVAMRGDYAEAHHALGSVLKARRDWRGAVASLRRAIALRPDEPAWIYTLGQVLQSSGDARGAADAFRSAERLRVRGAQERAASVLTVVGAQSLASGDAAAALTFFRRAVEAFDGYAPAYYQLGLTLQRLGQPDAARAAFARASTLNPSLVTPPELSRQK